MLKYYKKYLFLLLSLLLFISFPVNAEDKYPTPTNYKYINDYVGIMDISQIETIVSIGKELEDKTTSEATIVIIDTLNNIPIEDYANKLFRTWGLGKKEKDNGLLILLVLNDKQWRVEVGRGLEGALPDVLTNKIMESLARPKFIEGYYGDGLLDSYSTMCDYIAKEYNVTLEKSLNVSLPESYRSSSNSSNGFLFSLVILVLASIDILFNRGRVISTILQLIFWNNYFGGGRKGGNSGGGFGGFGGGSSNGGGSSGNW